METLTPAHVQEALDKLNLGIQIRTFDASTATSQLAAEAVGCELGQIVKSLCFIIDGQPTLILASGDQTVDERKLANIYQVGRKKVRMAKPEECIAIFGYPPGGVPPVGHRTNGFPIYIDSSLKRYEQLYAAGGTYDTIFPITLEQLLQATKGQFSDVVRDT